MSTLRTFVSRAYWCNPAGQKYDFEPACLSVEEAKKSQETTWLDELLEDGIVVPQEGNEDRSLSILVCGAPGTGKSSLVNELCWRWCIEKDTGWRELLGDAGDQPRILYITTESSGKLLMKNARSLGWERRLPEGRTLEDIYVTVERRDRRALARGTISVMEIPTAEDLLNLIAGNKGATGRWLARKFRTGGASLAEIWRSANRDALPKTDVLVFDSLNIIPADSSGSALTSAYEWLTRLGAKVVVFVADANRQQGATHPRANAATETWDFACDMVWQLDRKYNTTGHIGYMSRQFEIVKARYQKHAWGKHQLKIQEGIDLEPLNGPSVTAEERLELESKRLRAHPFRERGGIFIFPSIHFILSRYKHEGKRMPDDREGEANASDAENKDAQSKVDHLWEGLSLSYPSGRCTALLGQPGGHKSHLAFEEVMCRLQSDEKACALVVSLRDDEGLTRRTMTRILQGILRQTESEEAAALMETYEKHEARLDISYFPPGYITPEEFFHRIILSIKRLKATIAGAKITLVFNSVEQLSTRFPLCTQEPIFIPSIVQMLSAEGVSSFFVAAGSSETQLSANSYGLETVAELILHFERAAMAKPDYLASLAKAGMKASPRKLKDTFFPRQVSKLQVNRFAGGRAAGAFGYLDLIEDEHHPLAGAGKVALHRLVFLPPTSEKPNGKKHTP